MFDQITIIGCGLIGSSIFKALKKKSSIKKIITFDNNKSAMEVIKKDNLSDKIVSSSAEAVKNSDLVLFDLNSYMSNIEYSLVKNKNNFFNTYFGYQMFETWGVKSLIRI